MKTAFGRSALGPGVADGCRAVVAVGAARAVGVAVAVGSAVAVGVGIVEGDGESDGESGAEGDGESDGPIGAVGGGAVGTGITDVVPGSRPTQATVRSATRSRQSPRITLIPSTSVAQRASIGVRRLRVSGEPQDAKRLCWVRRD